MPHKKKDIDELSPEDQEWARHIGGFGAWKGALRAAVAENKAARVAYLMGKHRPSGERRLALAQTAIENGAAEALAAVIAEQGFDFEQGGFTELEYLFDNREHLEDLFAAALERRDLSIWKVLCARNAEEQYVTIGQRAPLRRAAAAKWHEGVAWHLDSATAEEVASFEIALHDMSKGTVEDLSFTLSWTHKFTGYGPALNDALKIVAKEGAVDKLSLLLDKGADPNDSGGEALHLALESGKEAAFDLLVAHGGRLDEHGPSLLARLRHQAPRSALLAHVEEKVSAALEAAPGQQTPPGQRYHLIAPDAFSETLYLPEGRTLTTVFNFSTRQQTTIAERKMTKEEPAALAVTVRDFDEIMDRAVLDQAEAHLVRLGGAVPSAAEAAKPQGLAKPPGLHKPSPP